MNLLYFCRAPGVGSRELAPVGAFFVLRHRSAQAFSRASGYPSRRSARAPCPAATGGGIVSRANWSRIVVDTTAQETQNADSDESAEVL